MYVRNFSQGVDVDVGGVLPHDGQGEGRADVPRRGQDLRVEGGRRPARDQPHAGDRQAPEDGTRRCSSTRCRSTTSTASTKTRAKALRRSFDEQDLPRNVLLRRRLADPRRDDAAPGRGVREGVRALPVAEGDIIMLDNMLVTHARDTFERRAPDRRRHGRDERARRQLARVGRRPSAIAAAGRSWSAVRSDDRETQVCDARVWTHQRVGQEHLECVGQPARRRGREERLVVFDVTAERVRSELQLQRQVEAREANVDVDGRRSDVGEVEQVGRRRLEAEVDLEQRIEPRVAAPVARLPRPSRRADPGARTAPSAVSFTRAHEIAERGLPLVRTRSTSVFEKNPIMCSSSTRPRLAIGVPTRMSCCPLHRLSRLAKPASTTMNGVADSSRACSRRPVRRARAGAPRRGGCRRTSDVRGGPDRAATRAPAESPRGPAPRTTCAHPAPHPRAVVVATPRSRRTGSPIPASWRIPPFGRARYTSATSSNMIVSDHPSNAMWCSTSRAACRRRRGGTASRAQQDVGAQVEGNGATATARSVAMRSRSSTDRSRRSTTSISNDQSSSTTCSGSGVPVGRPFGAPRGAR